MLSAEYFCSGSVARDTFGHYGLASPIYTHFTSPIRRYAGTCTLLETWRLFNPSPVFIQMFSPIASWQLPSSILSCIHHFIRNHTSNASWRLSTGAIAWLRWLAAPVSSFMSGWRSRQKESAQEWELRRMRLLSALSVMDLVSSSLRKSCPTRNSAPIDVIPGLGLRVL
jgi:hypothetical protein